MAKMLGSASTAPKTERTANKNHQIDNEIKPELSLQLQLLVTKKDFQDRPHYKAVAETLEEILQAVESGQTTGGLQPRELKVPPKSKEPNKYQKLQFNKNKS